MGVYIEGMEMPTCCVLCRMSEYHVNNPYCKITEAKILRNRDRNNDCPLIPVPPHGDLIDRDALMKEGWLNLYKEVMYMGGCAIHELPLKNPSIAVIIPAEEGE